MTAIPAAKLISKVDESQIQDMGQKQTPVPPSDSINSGMNVGAQVPSPLAKAAGYRTVVGSTPGNHSPELHDGVTPALDSIKNPPSPREAHGQAPLSGKQKVGAALEPTSDTSGID